MNLFGDETEDASKKVDKLNKDLEKQKDLTDKLNDEVDRNAEIEKLRAQIAGKTEAEIVNIEKAAQDAKIKNLYNHYLKSQKIFDAIKAAKAPSEDLEKFRLAEQKAYDAWIAALDNRTISRLQREKDAADKSREQEKAAREKAAADLKKWREDRQALEKRIKEEAIDDALKVAAAEKEAEAAKTIAIQEEIKKRDQARQEQLDGEKARNDREKQEAKELNDLKINLALQGFDLINQLTALTENNNKESAKRAFNVNKAFQLAQATIEGYRGTLKAYQEAPPGFKIVSAGLAAAFLTNFGGEYIELKDVEKLDGDTAKAFSSFNGRGYKHLNLQHCNQVDEKATNEIGNNWDFQAYLGISIDDLTVEKAEDLANYSGEDLVLTAIPNINHLPEEQKEILSKARDNGKNILFGIFAQ